MFIFIKKYFSLKCRLTTLSFIQRLYTGITASFICLSSVQASPYCYPKHYKNGLNYVRVDYTPFPNYSIVSDVYSTNPLVIGKLREVERGENFVKITAKMQNSNGVVDCTVNYGAGKYRNGFDPDMTTFSCGNILLKKSASREYGFNGGVEFSEGLIGANKYFIINAIRPFSDLRLPKKYTPPSTEKLFGFKSLSKCINLMTPGYSSDGYENLTYAYGPPFGYTAPPYACVHKSICEVNGTSTNISERLLLVPIKYKEYFKNIYNIYNNSPPGAVEQQYPITKKQLEIFFDNSDILPVELLINVFAPVK